MGFVNGDTSASLTTQPTLATQAASGSHVGSDPIAASGAVDPDYAIAYINGTLSVTPAPLTIAADNASKTYGASTPVLTASYSGFVNGDNSTSLAKPPTLATASGHVGSFAITASGAVDPDYIIHYVAGTLSITPAPLTILVADASKTYGAALPTLSASYSGFVNGDTQASLAALPVLSTTATVSNHVGLYAITASGAADPDYSIQMVTGDLSVTPAPLTIAANDQTTVSGSPLPTLAASYHGFMNGDSPLNLTTPVALSTEATPQSPPGDYLIAASGATSPDYAITFVPGTLNIQPATTVPTPTVRSIQVVKHRNSIMEIVVQFNGSVDPGAASATSSYRLATGAINKHKIVYNHVHVMKSASYNVQTDRVTLTLKRGIAATSKLQLTIGKAMLRETTSPAFSFNAKGLSVSPIATPAVSALAFDASMAKGMEIRGHGH